MTGLEQWIFSFSQESREVFAYVLMGVTIFILFALLLGKTLWAHTYLYLYVRRRLKKGNVTPAEVRAQIHELQHPLWALRHLAKRKFGGDSPETRRDYLKRFTYLHFRRSRVWKKDADTVPV